MVEIRSKTLTPEYIKEFGNTIKNFAMGDEQPNGDYVFDFISPDGKITNNELEKIKEVITSYITHNELMELQNTSNDVFNKLIGWNDNLIRLKNYIRKQGAIDGLIIAQKNSIDQKNTADKDIRKQITNLINQHTDQQESKNIHF